MTAATSPLRQKFQELKSDPALQVLLLASPLGRKAAAFLAELGKELEALDAAGAELLHLVDAQAVRLAELEQRTAGLAELHLQVAKLEARPAAPTRHFPDQHPLRSR